MIFQLCQLFCIGDGSGGDPDEVIGDEVDKGGDGALPEVEGELASSTTEEIGDAMISNQRSVKGVVKEKTQVDGNLFKTKRGRGPRLLMPVWLRKKRQLLSSPTSGGDTSDLSKYVEVYLCDNCDEDFDRLQDLTTHGKGCSKKEVPISPIPLDLALHIVLSTFSGGLLGGRVDTTAVVSCKQLQALLQNGKASLSKEVEGWSKAEGQ